MSAGADSGAETGTDVDVDAGVDTGQEAECRSVWDYDSAEERAKDVHIRDLDFEPRWNGHAPTETAYQGTDMVVCKHCGDVSTTREKLAEKGRCPE